MRKAKKILTGLVLPLLIGAIVGFVLAASRAPTTPPEYYYSATEYTYNGGVLSFLVWLISLAVTICIALMLSIIIHEAGHLIGGKLSGYELIMFRIDKLALIKKDGKLQLKKYELAGTGGQCLMSPPDSTDTDYKYPFLLYNLSGSLANFATAAITFPLYLVTTGIIASLFVNLAIMGVALGLLNLIPLRISGISNDGHNALKCSKELSSRRAFWIQLKYVGLITQGTRTREMPEEWMADIGTPQNPLAGFLTNLRFDYLIDKGEHEQAVEYATKIIETPSKMLALHKNELRCGLLFFELIGENRPSEIKRLHTPELRDHIKLLKTHLSKIRLQYALERLHNKNEAAAKKALAAFNKALLTTPFAGEIEGERELISLVQNYN
jgi:ribosomal protein L29